MTCNFKQVVACVTTARQSHDHVDPGKLVYVCPLIYASIYLHVHVRMYVRLARHARTSEERWNRLPG